MLIAGQGYATERGILSREECVDVIAALSREGVRKGRAGARHLMSHPAVAALATGGRLLSLARGILGPETEPFRATLFEKTGQANWLVAWHQDTALPLTSRFNAPGWGPWSEKEGVLYAHAPAWALLRVLALRVYLDDSTPANGPLRVIPGSHTAGVLNDEEVREYARTHAHVECPVPQGGVLAMSPLIIHASSKSITGNPRCVLHLEYAASLDLGPGIVLAVA